MTIEEAALHLERLYGIVSEEYKRALDVADDALGKQVAKKPIKRDDNLDLCPACMCGFGVKIVDNYCSYCGQKLKWEEEE